MPYEAVGRRQPSAVTPMPEEYAVAIWATRLSIGLIST